MALELDPAGGPGRGWPALAAAVFAATLFATTLPAVAAQQTLPEGAAADPHLTLSLRAAELPLVHRGRKTDGRSADAALSPAVRYAVNVWAEVAATHGLSVVVPREAEALVIGPGDVQLLERAAEVMDDAWELLAPLTPPDGVRPRATVAFLFDADGFRTPGWKAVLDAFVARRQMPRSDARRMELTPSGFVMHGAPLFVQPTWDMAGDASAGDDEFRLDNEVAHKLADCVVRERFDQQPACLRWGLGYVVEQRLFHSSYQFDTNGFVASADHFGWPGRAAEAFAALAKQKGDPRFAGRLLDETAAGRPVKPQLVAWGVLDYLLAREPQMLADTLGELGALHRTAAKGRLPADFVGDQDAAAAVLERRLAELEPRDLAKHVKRLK